MTTPSLRVLCVDDNRDAATSLAAVLKLHGHDARCAFDGADGLRVAHHFRPDACVVGVNTTGMDGCEVAARLRENLGTDVLLVALTAGPAGAYADRIDAAGFDWLFAKPVAVGDLLGVFGEFAAARAGRSHSVPAGTR